MTVVGHLQQQAVLVVSLDSLVKLSLQSRQARSVRYMHDLMMESGVACIRLW
jgi:hypothetical protein